VHVLEEGHGAKGQPNRPRWPTMQHVPLVPADMAGRIVGPHVSNWGRSRARHQLPVTANQQMPATAWQPMHCGEVCMHCGMHTSPACNYRSCACASCAVKGLCIIVMQNGASATESWFGTFVNQGRTIFAHSQCDFVMESSRSRKEFKAYN
jgi:hypothetical protein